MNAYGNLLGVYGSLRIGHGNYQHFLADTRCISEKDTLAGYQLFTWQDGGYPCIVKTGEPADIVVIDLFDLNYTRHGDPVSIGNSIDNMEYGAGYEKELVTLESGAVAWVYPMTLERAEGSGMTCHVESGDWTEWCDEREARE